MLQKTILKMWGGITVTSREIAKRRKEIENDFQSTANIFNGKLSEARKDYETKIAELQKECTHMWENGEDAKEQLATMSLCTICRKKFY